MASDEVCKVVSSIKMLGRSPFPALFHEENVLKTFHAKSRATVNLNALNVCSIHDKSAKEIVIYVCNVTFYDEIHRSNYQIKQNDVVSRMVRGRTRTKTQEKTGNSDCAQFIADFCERLDEDEMEEQFEY